MRKYILLLVIGLLGLLVSGGNASAEDIDVVHLKNGSIIKGIVTEIIPSETIKIETADGSVFVYQFDEIDKMTKTRVDVLAEMVDVVHLKNGSIIKGIVTEIIPSETIKIETAGGSIFVYQFDEIQSITKEEKVEKVNEVPTQQIFFKDPSYALGSGCGIGCLSWFAPAPFPIILGIGQVYNEEYIKALIFFGVGAYAQYDLSKLGYTSYLTEEDTQRALFDMILLGSSMVWSAFDAYYSARRINLEAEKKVSSTSLNYIPHQGMMASYNVRF